MNPTRATPDELRDALAILADGRRPKKRRGECDCGDKNVCVG